ERGNRPTMAGRSFAAGTRAGRPAGWAIGSGRHRRTLAGMAPEVTKTDDEWRAELSPEQYEVLRRKGTERAFTGKYVNNHDDGSYRCAGCGAVLFTSDTKFDSGSGWPSFTEPAVAEVVELHQDRSFGMTRTEVT